VLTVDGVDVVNATDSASVDKLNEACFRPSRSVHTFSISTSGERARTSPWSPPIDVDAGSECRTIRRHGKVAYMLFNDHLATSEQALVTPSASSRDERHRPGDRHPLQRGGYLDIASEVAYMVAAPAHRRADVREDCVQRQVHDTDPVTGAIIQPIPFYSTSQGFSVPNGQALPTLNSRGRSC